MVFNSLTTDRHHFIIKRCDEAKVRVSQSCRAIPESSKSRLGGENRERGKPPLMHEVAATTDCKKALADKVLTFCTLKNVVKVGCLSQRWFKLWESGVKVDTVVALT